MKNTCEKLSQSQQLVYGLIHEKAVSVAEIAKACHLSESTLYNLLKGERKNLHPKNFTRLFHFYLAATYQSLITNFQTH